MEITQLLSIVPMRQHLNRPISFSLVSALGMSMLISQALGAGLVIPDNGSVATARGGASVSGIHDPSAGFLNPSLLSRLSGLRISYHHNLIMSNVSFERTESVIPDSYSEYDQLSESEQAIGRGRSENESPFFPLNGLLAISYQLNPKMTLGFSVHGPNSGGASSYDELSSSRYMMTDFSGLLGFVGGSFAYGGDRWGVGTTLQLASMTNMNYKMIVDGTSNQTLNPYVSGFDVEAEIDVSAAPEFTALLGAWFRPTKSFEIAASGRVLPVHFRAEGDVRVANTVTPTVFPESSLKIEGGSAAFDFSLPQTARLGFRYINIDQNGAENFDLELALVYEGWSVMDELEVELKGYVMALSADLQNVVIPKKWRDTLSARLGSTWRALPYLSLHSGVFFEQGASPEAYAHIDFPSYDRFGGSLGLSFFITKNLELVVGYLQIFEHQIEVSEFEGKVFQQRPISPCPERCGMNDAGENYSGVPANAGLHTISFQSFTLGINSSF